MAFIAAAVIGGVGAIAGGLIGASGAKKAAAAQERAAQLGVDEQRRQYDTSRADLAPYRESGSANLNRLNFLLGTPTGSNVRPTGPSRDSFNRTRTVAGTGGGTSAPVYRLPYNPYNPNNGIQNDYGIGRTPVAGPTTESYFDQAGYDAATAQTAADQAAWDAQAQDPEYGSLMRDFTGQDLENEPGYQFALKQGLGAIDQGSIFSGNYLSGNRAKEAMRYGTDYAGTKYNDAFSRDSQNKSRKYNFLTGMTNQGMGATSAGAQMGQQTANSVSNLYGQAGNASAAGSIGAGNAWQGALSGVGNAATTGLVGNYLTGGGTGNIPRISSAPPPRGNQASISLSPFGN